MIELWPTAMLAKGPGVHQAGLVFGRAHQGGVDGVAHEGRHGVAHFQVAGGDRFAALVEGHGDVVEALFQVGQILGHGQDRHALGTHGDAELGLHHEAVGAAADADDDVAQGLGAEVDDPAHFDTGGIDVQPAHLGQAGQLLVIVVALMLHAGGHRHHGQVVGVHDVVDVAGEAQGEFGHRDQQGVSAAGRGALDVHGRAARGLAQGAADVFAALAQTFDQPSEVVLLPSPNGVGVMAVTSMYLPSGFP
jgi:hypothetical protein